MSTSVAEEPIPQKTSLPFLIAIIVVAIGTILSMFAYRILVDKESRLVNAQLDAAAEHRVRVLEKAFRQSSFAPARFGPRFDMTRRDARQRFETLAQRRLEANRAVRFLCWAPKVKSDKQQEHEAIAHDQGVKEYRVHQFGDAKPGQDLFPIFFCTSEETTRDQLGLDLGSIPECAVAIDSAITTGNAASTQPFHWPADPDKFATIVVVRPFITTRADQDTREDRDQNLVGFGISVINADVMIADAFAEFPQDVDLHIYKTNPGKEPTLVGKYIAQDKTVNFAGHDLIPGDTAKQITTKSKLQVAGGWSIQCIATPEFLDGRSIRRFPALVAFLGIALSFAFASYLRIILDQKNQIEQLSEKKTAELREANKFLDSVVDNIPTMLFMKDAKDLKFVRFNKAGEELVGRSREDLEGRSDFDLYPKEEAEFFTQKDRDVLESKAMLDIEEEDLMTSNGLRILHTKKIPICDESGEPTHLLGISEDVTERKKALEDLQRAKDAAEIANRAKSEFMANMSHEIRTPMNAIMGMTELVLDSELNPAQKDYLTTVYESADSLLKIINEILDFSKIEAGKLELQAHDFDLREELGAMLKPFGPRAHEKDIELVWHVNKEVPTWICADWMRLRQMLINLVGNAIKFTKMGEVLVDVKSETVDDKDIKLHFSVSDTGIGIPAEKIESIFTPFEQVDMSSTRQFGGTGLGLTITRRLAEAMGGSIWAESTMGQGTTFHFTAMLKQGQPAANGGGLPNLDDVTALVLDDNQTNCQILQEVLQNWGIGVQAVLSAEQAMQHLQEIVQQKQPLPILISDVHMPNVDGYEFLEQLRTQEPFEELVVIMLTSEGRQADVGRCSELGVHSHLIKPVKQSELFHAIVDALGRRIVPSETIDSQEVVPLASLKILLAEDGKANQKMAVGLLTKWGHDVVVAENGAEAVENWQQQEFDVVLMDVQMPVMDGLEATRRIRELETDGDRHIPIIAMTAHAMSGDRDRCTAAGMDDYVSKPVRRSELNQALARFGKRLPDAIDDTQSDPVETDTGSDLLVIDWQANLEIAGGSHQLRGEIVAIATGEFPKLVAGLEVALQEQDAPTARRLAHTIKGEARTLSANKTCALAEVVEQSCANEDWGTANAGMPDLKAAVDELLDVCANQIPSS